MFNAQIMMDYFKIQTPYVMVTYVTSGVILTFLGIYEHIVNFGGAGATVTYNRIWIFIV